jgi:DNA-binding beta-propeller fold protein YncE
MRLLPVFLTFLLFLAACAPVATPQPEPTAPRAAPTEILPENPTPVSTATVETSLLAIVWEGRLKDNLLFAIDPASGNALPGYEPISLDFSTSQEFSPDRRTLAVISFPNEAAHNGSLVLIDLPTWTTRRFDLKLTGWVSSIAFSPDGKRLAIVHGESHSRVTIFDLAEEAIIAQEQFDSFVSRLKFTESGEGLMLYNAATNAWSGLSAGPPEIHLLDAADLNLVWSAEVTEVQDGIFPKEEDATPENIHEPGQAFYMSPGLVFAPEQDILYIVHADAEKLTTVDFESQTIRTVDIQDKLTWFEQLLSLTAGVAHAKIGDGMTRQAVVSPDGQFLYVAGVNNSTFQDKQGNWQMEQTPLGLEIIETRDGSRVEHIETDTTELSLSPDGRFLYLRNWGTHPKNLPWTEIFDTSSRQLVARKDNVSATPVLLMNGEFLLASTFSTGEYSHHMSILEPDGSSVLAEWTDSESVWWLTAP